MAQIKHLLILGLIAVLAGCAVGVKVCKTVGATTYSCSDDKNCCNDGFECCDEYWTTWRIIVFAGAGVILLGLVIVLLIVGIYHCCIKKNTKSDNTVQPYHSQPGGSYDQPPPPYEYQNETPFSHPPTLPPYTAGDKKKMVAMMQEENKN